MFIGLTQYDTTRVIDHDNNVARLVDSKLTT